jgi:hypothetical protein
LHKGRDIAGPLTGGRRPSHLPSRALREQVGYSPYTWRDKRPISRECEVGMSVRGAERARG